MTISPIPLPPDSSPRTRSTYNWASIEIGQWQRWLDLTGTDVSDDEARRRSDRIRVAARWHARHNGLKVESSSEDKGRLLDLRFTHRQG